MNLDFSSLQKAVQSLNRAIIRAKELPADEELRDAVIQRFEYTYELSCKLLKKQLANEMPYPEVVEGLNFRDLLREAAKRGIIANVEQWFAYREQRNITSHTYDGNKAEQVRQTAYSFVIDAEKLVAELLRRAS